MSDQAEVVKDEVKEEEVSIEETPIDTEAAFSPEAIAEAEIEGSEDNCLPSFFVGDDSFVDIGVDILTHSGNGRVLSVTRSDLGLELDGIVGSRRSSLTFKFTIPQYSDMTRYRKSASGQLTGTGELLLDEMKLRDLILMRHLKGWNLTDAHGAEVPLKMDENEGSVLSDESYSMVQQLHPTIVDVVMTLFKKEILLRS